RDAMMLLAVPAAAATFVLAAMALIGVPWNPGTVSLAPIALGIGIDYGLHIHERYSEGRTAGQEPALAVESAMGSLSRPIVASGMTTVAGFGVLMFSQFPVVRNFGITLVLVVAFSMLSAFVFLPAMLLVVDQEQPLKEQLLNRLGLGVGMDAKSEPLDLSDLPVPANEDVTAFARSANSEMVISGDTGTLRHTGEVAVVTTDRRVICVVRNDAEDPIVRSITLPSIRECDIEDGIRFRELSLRTQDDEIYRLRLTDGVALDPVLEEIGSGTEPSAAVRRHLDEVAEAITILEETPSVDEGLWATVDRAQDHLTAAEGLIDQISASESERLETLKREFRDAVHAAALAAGETKRLNAERHREAGRYTKASQAYRTALRILERGLETAEPVIGDLPGPVHQRRDHIQQRLSTLYQEVKGSAQDAVEEARSLEDPAQSIESWETALQHGQTAVALADTDEDFPGSVSTLKADLRRVAELCLAAHRDRAERLMSTAEALGADTALRDETYERAEIHLERAREIASEFGVGNPAAIETTIDRLTAKRRASSSASD
ncbi:MAG: MMPL family transporter, partial [Salinirussus sp.]